MKKILPLFVCAAGLLSSFAVPVAAGEWTPVADPGKIVPAAGEYAILISQKTFEDAGWAKIADTLKARYAGNIIVWKENVLDAEEALKKAAPRYIAFVARPEELDRVVVADLHRMTRRIDPDFYGDAIFGIITARSAEAAKRLVEEQKKPLLIERGVSTTNCDLERFKRHFFVTDWNPSEYIETKNGVPSSKKTLPEGEEIIELFAKKFTEINPQYLLSASHATEFNLEMPFSRGLITPANGTFYCLRTKDMRNFSRIIGRAENVLNYAKKEKLTALKATNDPKIWIAAGNCLFGDVFRSPDSVTATLLSDYGVRQLVGYTVPTWYGVGWDVHGNFFNGHQDVSVGQAWFFTNQRSMEKLPPELRTLDYPIRAEDMEGVKINEVYSCITEVKAPMSQDNLGRLHDRDVIAFYGDPLFRSSFDQKAKNCQPWQYKLLKNGKARRVVIAGTQGKERKSEFRFWFPEVCDTTKEIRFFRGKTKKTPEPVTPNFTATKNFLMLSDMLALAPGEELVLEYHVQ